MVRDSEPPPPLSAPSPGMLLEFLQIQMLESIPTNIVVAKIKQGLPKKLNEVYLTTLLSVLNKNGTMLLDNCEICHKTRIFVLIV